MRPIEVVPIWAISSVVGVLAAYSAEVYPTGVRSRGSRLAAAASKACGGDARAHERCERRRRVVVIGDGDLPGDTTRALSAEFSVLRDVSGHRFWSMTSR